MNTAVEQDSYRTMSDEELAALKPTDTEKLRSLVRGINRIGPSKSEQFIERAAHKLSWFLSAGHTLHGFNLRLFSEVTNHEMGLSARAFFVSWSDETAERRMAERIKSGALKVVEGGRIVTAPPECKKPRVKKLVCHKCNHAFEAYRRNTLRCPRCRGVNDPFARVCASGDDCIGSDKIGTPAPAAEGRQYCNEHCRGCHAVRMQKRVKAGLRDAKKVTQNPNKIEGTKSNALETGARVHTA
jgi:rubrerythrin